MPRLPESARASGDLRALTLKRLQEQPSFGTTGLAAHRTRLTAHGSPLMAPTRGLQALPTSWAGSWRLAYRSEGLADGQQGGGFQAGPADQESGHAPNTRQGCRIFGADRATVQDSGRV